MLSEKPVAKDVATARELISWFEEGGEAKKGVTWGVAENFRYLGSYEKAAEEAAKLGRVLGFRLRMNALVTGGKYFDTPWRKHPGYQGGFLLDGGVHFIAGIRQMLGPENAITRVAAFTAQLQKHLPPIDTLNATCRTATGISGTVNISFGTTFKGSGYSVACEKGTVTVLGSDVVVEKDGVEEKFGFPEDCAGVRQEIKAWAAALEKGQLEDRQGPAEALRDLQILEALFKSGEQDGAPLDTGL